MTTPAEIDFRVHAIRGGSDEFGRVDFHRMLTSLIQVKQPTATEIRADPGDWGIDTFVGSLVDAVSIWQSKYFCDRIGKSQQAAIRESFASAVNNARKHKYKIESWTLCVATTLSAPERTWWDRKVRGWQRDHPDLRIDLWDAPRLRTMLMAPDAAHVFATFYGPNRDWSAHPEAALALPTPELSETPEYDDALFMRQLRVAGATETDQQRLAFFNAELLVRDVAARGVPHQVAALRDIDAEVHAVWEERWNDPDLTPRATDYSPSALRLLASVLKGVRTVPAPPELPVRLRHLRGMLHRVVEDGRAGWVCDWKDVARNHRGDRAAPASSTAADATLVAAVAPAATSSRHAADGGDTA